MAEGGSNPFDQFNADPAPNPFDQFDRAGGTFGNIERVADKVSGAGESFVSGVGGGVAAGFSKLNRYLGMSVAGLGVLGDALHSHFTGQPETGLQDYAFSHFVEPNDKVTEHAEGYTKDVVHPTAAALGGTTGELGSELVQMVATDGGITPKLAEEAVPGAQAVGKLFEEGSRSPVGAAFEQFGEGLRRSTGFSALPASTSGEQVAEETYDETGNPVQAANAGLTQAGLTTLTDAFPVSVDGKLLNRIATGAASGAVFGEASRQAMNAVQPADKHQDFSWGGLAENALFSAAMGAAFHGPAEENPNLVMQRYNGLRDRAEQGDAHAAVANDLVGDLTAVDGLSGAAIDAAEFGAKAGQTAAVAPHDQLIQTSDRYRQIYQAARPDMDPAAAEQYARTAYSQEVATNSAWTAYTEAKKTKTGQLVQAKLASDIKQALGAARHLVPAAEMNKLARWAFTKPRGSLAVRDALRQTVESRKVPDYVEDEQGANFYPDGALTEDAFMRDRRPEMVSVAYADTPQVRTALNGANVVPYRLNNGTLAVLGHPDSVDALNETMISQGLAPAPEVVDAHAQAEVQPGRPEEGAGAPAGAEGGHDAAARPAAEAGQPAEAHGEPQGQAEVVAPAPHVSVAERAQPVVDKLVERGVVAPVNREGTITVHPEAGEEAAQHALDVAAADTYLEPTPAQAEAGNYRKGGVLFKSPKGDIKVRIETPDGAVRKGDWGSRKIRGAHYGYIPGTRAADGQPVDVLLTRHAHDDSRPVAVINQHGKDGLHDEIKVVLGAKNRAEAMQTYLKQYPPGMASELLPKGKLNVTMMSREKFMRYLKSGDTDVPPHPVSGLPMAHLRRKPVHVPEEVENRAGRDRQAGQGQEPTPAAGQQRARVPSRAEGSAKPRPYQGLTVASEAPVYTHGTSAHPVSAVGVHYSPKADLTHLEPRMAGTGSAGGERLRHGASLGNGDPLTSMMHFYVRTGEHLPPKERVVQGDHAYEVRLHNLYDVKADPDGILQRLEEQGYGNNRDMALEEIHDAGYDGWIAPSLPGMPEGHVASVFGDGKVPVKAVGKAEEPRASLKAKVSKAESITETPAFRKWFGDSKVVDAEGRPLVVYHGTAFDFSQFRHSRADGFYFTDDRDAASVYAHEAESEDSESGSHPDPGPNVMPVYLSIKNPIVLDGKWQRENMDDGGEWNWMILDDELSGAKKAGHDGAILQDFMDFSGFVYGEGRKEHRYTQYVAFHPEQIKSATGNSGAFDPKNPDINAALNRATKPEAVEPKFATVARKPIESPPTPAEATSQFSWEAIPSTTIPGNAWLHDASPAFREAYTRAIHEAIGPAILDEFGIDHAGVTIGYGGWEGRVNPSAQERVAWSPAQQAQLEKAAATYGLLLKQDGVAYHHPDYATSLKEANGVHVEAGRPLSEAETTTLYNRVAELAQERFGLTEGEANGFAPIPTETGVRFLNFDENVPNRAFQKMVDDAARTLPDDLTLTTHAFKAEGDLIGNDWSTQPHGEGYKQRLVETGGWDSARRALDRLGPQVEKITEAFRERARQGEAGEGAKAQADTADAAARAEAGRVERATLARHVERFTGAWKGRAAMEVQRTPDDLPADHPVRQWFHAVGAPDDLAGTYYNGRMYLFADRIRDLADAEKITLHEMVGHGGMRAVFGDDFEGFLADALPAMRDTPLFKEVTDTYRAQMPNISDEVLADEYMAALAEDANNAAYAPVWRRLLASTRNWLRSHGFRKLQWTEDDLKALVRATYRGIRDGRISLAGLEPPTVTFDDQHHMSTSTYVGPKGSRGFVDHFADGSRELRVGGLDAAGLRRVERDGQDYLDVAGSLDFTEPAELLHLTRFAGEEGLDGVLLDKAAVDADTLAAAGIPHEDAGDAWRLPASQGVSSPMASLRNRAVGSPAQEAILKKAIAHDQYNMSWSDRMQQHLRDIRDRIMSGDTALHLKQGYVDALASIGRYERRINGGQLLDAAESAYKSTWMAKNTEQILAGVMKLGVPRYNAGSFEPVHGRKGLMDIFAPLYQTRDGKSLDMLWEGYAYARRANELIQQTNHDGTPREKLLDQDEIDELLKLGDQYPQFKQVLDDYQKFNNQLLDLAVDRGALSREMADLWKQNTYVPFYRALEGDTEGAPMKSSRSISGKKVSSARLHGSELAAQPIIENIIKNTGAILDKVYANEAMRRVVALTNGVGMERVKFPFSPVNLSLGEIERTLQKIGLHVGGKSKVTGRYFHYVPQAYMERLVQFFRMSKPLGHDIVSVMENGKPVYYKVTDPMLLRSVTAFTDIHKFDEVLGAVLGIPAKLLRQGIVLDPRFMFRNLFRDTVTSWVQSGMNPNVFKDLGRNAKEVFTDSNFINALRVAGYNGNEYYRVDQLREHLHEMHGNDKVTLLDTPLKLYRAYHKIGFISEQLNRMAVAKATLEHGGSMAEAAWQAQNTLNFQMRGDSRAMQLLIRAVPFLNARIQGLNRLYDGMLGRSEPTEARKAVIAFLYKSVALAVAGLALDAWNWDDPRYDRIPEASKDTYYHFFIGDSHFILPKPFEIGAITGTVPERVLRVIAGKDNKRTFADAMKRMATNTFQFSVIPQTLQPLLEDWANKDSFTGTPIVNQSEQNQLPQGQYSARTSSAVKAISHHLPGFAPDALRSPDRLEHLIRGYTGTLGSYLLMMADATMRATGQAPAAPESRWGNQAVGAILGTIGYGDANTDPRTKYLQQYYDAQDMADEAAATVRKLVKEGHYEDAREVLQDNRTPLAYRTELKAIGKQMKMLRAAEIAIYQSTALSPAEKRERLTAIQQTRVKLLDRAGPMLELVTDFH